MWECDVEGDGRHRPHAHVPGWWRAPCWRSSAGSVCSLQGWSRWSSSWRELEILLGMGPWRIYSGAERKQLMCCQSKGQCAVSATGIKMKTLSVKLERKSHYSSQHFSIFPYVSCAHVTTQQMVQAHFPLWLVADLQGGNLVPHEYCVLQQPFT